MNNKLYEIHKYIDRIKKYAYQDIYNLENQVLNKNPYNSDFIKNYLYNVEKKKQSSFFKLKKIIVFYIKNIVRLLIYLIGFILYKYKAKKCSIDFSKNLIFIDTFFLVDKIIKEKKFNENYFVGLYNVLNKNSKEYIFLPRLFGLTKNPFKIIQLMNVLNNDKNVFLFEYELLSFIDIIRIFNFILIYPFKTIEVLQKNDSDIDKLFNYEIINSLSNTSFTAYIRYLVGKKLSSKIENNVKIISWMEFQNLEKTFNRAIKESNKDIQIYGCQFSIYYKEYISMHLTDIDYDLKITPTTVLLNGRYNYSDSKRQVFNSGVSLRYKNLFNMDLVSSNNLQTLILLTYQIEESIQLLEYSQGLENIVVKTHPTTSIKQFSKYIKKGWKYSQLSIYDQLSTARIVIVGSMSGTGLEAVSCGISVIIIASQDNLTSNPLVEYGKGKIWDIAFSKDDVKRLYNKLIKYRKNNIEELNKISNWYKDNFFIEPTEENIVKSFELGKRNLVR